MVLGRVGEISSHPGIYSASAAFLNCSMQLLSSKINSMKKVKNN